MSRKIWIVVIAFAAILLVNNLHIFGRSGLGNFVNFVLTLIIIYRGYVLYQKTKNFILPVSINPIPKNVTYKPTRKNNVHSGINPPEVTHNTANQLWIVALIFVIVFILAAYPVVSAGSINFFVWGDNILSTGTGNLPVVMWALAGLAFGAVAGSVVIWLKYHVQFKWCLVTIIPFFSVLILLQSMSDPLQSIEPRPILVTADSARTVRVDVAPEAPKRKKHSGVKPIRSRETEVKLPIATVDECVRQQASVSINARSDSVNVYYRTAAYKDGPWGEWKSKFVPQQGQFSLTENGQVRANSLQYYYESRSVFTRSAQNPYTRVLCEEQLVIDTY